MSRIVRTAYFINGYRPLYPTWAVNASFALKRIAYPETDSAFLDNEKDVDRIYALSFMKNITKSSLINLGFVYNDYQSNFENKTYQKRLFNVSYIYSF